MFKYDCICSANTMNFIHNIGTNWRGGCCDLAELQAKIDVDKGSAEQIPEIPNAKVKGGKKK